ncbi:MAG TPA: LysR family transcriptional regulator [Paracoccaceae bacterium]|nr:LysR family transcriptional regulator [Paracoccaceae bacterium]
MTATQHLRALQALELALRHGSIQRAAEDMGITPAAAGQRIRALEDYLGTDLLLRGRSGLHPTPALEAALADLRAAFAAVERVTETLDFQRVSELHLLADPDWAELWLMPRLPAFRAAHPNIRFCINGQGDVPVRLGAPDMRILRSDDPRGSLLFSDVQVAVTGPDNMRRLGDWDQDFELEGLPLLHVDTEPGVARLPGWPDWVERFGRRREGMARGVHYRNLRLALEAVRRNVGFLICSLALARRDLAAGSVVLVYPADRHLPDVAPHRMFLRSETRASAQVRRFAEWLAVQAAETGAWIAETCAVPPDRAFP